MKLLSSFQLISAITIPLALVTIPFALGCNDFPTSDTEKSVLPNSVVQTFLSDPAKKGTTEANEQKEANAKQQVSGIWPNWRGPNFDGISQETEWSAKWEETGPPISWTKQVGTGYSSVSVADGKLFTMGHRGGKETVFCVDAKNGKEIWKHTYLSALVDNLNAGGPAATPTIHQTHLYTNSRDGRVICFEKETGKVVWEVELQKLLKMSLPEWGFSCSPLVYHDWIILEAGRVIALEKTTGKLIWQTKAYEPGYGTPALFQFKDDDFFAALTCTGLLIVRAKDGKEIANYDWSSPFRTNSTTPIIKEDTIFISTGYNIGCGLFRFSGSDLKPIYTNRDMRNHFNNSVLFNGYLYGFDGNSNLGRTVHLVCMNYETGKVAWKHRGLGCGSLLISNGKLILLSDEGTLVTAEATAEGFQEISRVKVLDHQCWTVPVLANGYVYCRDSAGKLVCLNLNPSE